MNNGNGEHDPADLVGLLAGELPVASRAAVRAHLDGCDTCRRDLVDAAFVVGELRDAARHGIVEPAAVPPFLGPGAPASRPAAEDVRVAPVLPAPVPVSSLPRRGVRGRLVALVAAVLAVGAAGGVTAGRLSAGTTGSPAPSEAVVRLVPTGNRPSLESGVARMDGPGARQHMYLTVSDLAMLPGGEHYEVWLINLRTGRTLAIGSVPANGAARYPAPQATVRRFSAIDVTVQTTADRGRHSARSVLRGLL